MSKLKFHTKKEISIQLQVSRCIDTCCLFRVDRNFCQEVIVQDSSNWVRKRTTSSWSWHKLNNSLFFIGYSLASTAGLFLLNWLPFLRHGKANHSKFYNMHNIRGTFFTEVKCDPKHKHELIKRWHFLRNELAPADMTPSFQPVVRKYYIKVLQTGRLVDIFAMYKRKLRIINSNKFFQ